MHSIRVKITAITIVAILTSILSVYAASFLIIQSETDKNSVGMMNLIDQDTQKSLEKYFESISQSVEIAANIAVDSLDSVFLVECGAVKIGGEESVQTAEQTAALDAYLKDYCGKIQEYFSGVASYTNGVTAYYYYINPEISRNERGFFYMKIGKTGFISQEPVDVTQLPASETLGASWYETAVSRGRPCWVGPYTSPSAGETWICSYFVPIYKAGMIIGVMGMDIPCDTLKAQIEAIRVYDTGYVCLLDGEGRVIYHPDLPIGSDIDDLGLDVHSEILKKRDSGDELIRYTANGKERQLSFSTLTNGMKLVSVAPANEINASWSRLGKAILLITAVVVVFYVVLILFLIHAITSPLKQLTDASQRLADEDYDVDLNYRGNNEIGTLTVAFNRMREQIRRSMDDLNHQILHDRLTDLPNMRHFFTLAEEERDRLLAEGRHPVMVYFNMIGLSLYNRQYGFDKGDQVILNLAGILERTFGDHRVCRLNGDHFAAVSDEESIEAELQAVLKECETAADGMQLRIRVGVYPNRLETVDVNVACDRAKAACDTKMGELASSVSYFDEKMLKKGEVYRHIVNNLDQALAEGWVKVYYQSIVRAANGKVCDEEALARWIDPVLGFLSPADFIPALENAKLIYKLDLYVVDQVLKKMKQQTDAGFYVVPQSINLSRMDFESCDVVEEIRRRVDDAGVDRAMISVEITESVIGGDFEFMKEQVGRFQELGFPVWMDDFGSGYSSLDVLQQIHFDVIKFDMRFMERFDEGDQSKIILTELMKMAIALGSETVCEGVEQKNQVEFLREIGCTRIQGYYYGKPLPFECILDLFFKQGTNLKFENPDETDYYTAIGRINLYDMAALANEKDESLHQYFNTLPMGIMEVNGDKINYVRCNRSYRDFVQHTLGIPYETEEIDCSDLSSKVGAGFLQAVVRCGRDGKRGVLDDKVNEDTTVHALIRRVSVNPVTGTAAIAVAVLAVMKDGDNAETNYGQIASALASDYVNLYYVNLETEKFTEYSPDAARENLALERRGEDFFAAARRDAQIHIYKEDLENFIKTFTKQNVVNALDTEGSFRMTYRLMLAGKPTYVSLKAVRMPSDRYHIIVGVNNVDAETRQKEALTRIQAEKTIYSRFSALTRDFICIYTVDPVTSHYVEFTSTSDFAVLGVPREGEDFFAQSLKEAERLIYPEDFEKLQTLLTRENVMREVEKNGFYSFNYRMLLNGEPQYLSLKAALVEEADGKKLIIGFNNIDGQVKREQEYARKLADARKRANLDTLTGVKNKAAFKLTTDVLSKQIKAGQNVRFAIALFCLAGLEKLNEEKGREAGDETLRGVCAAICGTFKHSPVYRIAEDQFAVLVQRHNYDCLDALMAEAKEKIRLSGWKVSCAAAAYNGQESPTAVLARAERLCGAE